MEAINIGIVEDKYPLLKGWLDVFVNFEEVKVIFTAMDGQEALEKTNHFANQVDVLLMDIEMPIMNGIEATRQLKIAFPNLKILMLTVFDDEENIFNAIKAGASGYLLKGEKPGKVITAIEQVMEGRLPMSPLVAMKTLTFMQTSMEAPKGKEQLDDYSLTEREIEILEHLSKGKTYQTIATELFISPKTVRRHIENIYKKLGVHSKYEVVDKALKNKWFT